MGVQQCWESESLRRTGLHLSLSAKSSLYLPAFEISRSCRTASGSFRERQVRKSAVQGQHLLQEGAQRKISDMMGGGGGSSLYQTENGKMAQDKLYYDQLCPVVKVLVKGGMGRRSFEKEIWMDPKSSTIRSWRNKSCSSRWKRKIQRKG
jgi:hypothetical protein